MSIRIWRRFRIAPGVTLNISKRGFSFSFGRRGAHLTVGTKGTTASVGLPGTGVSYRKGLSHKAVHDLVKEKTDTDDGNDDLAEAGDRKFFDKFD